MERQDLLKKYTPAQVTRALKQLAKEDPKLEAELRGMIEALPAEQA